MGPKLVTVVNLPKGVVITQPVGQGNMAAIFDNQEQAHEWLGARNYVLAHQPSRDEGDYVSGVYVRLGGAGGRVA